MTSFRGHTWPDCTNDCACFRADPGYPNSGICSADVGEPDGRARDAAGRALTWSSNEACRFTCHTPEARSLTATLF